MKVPSQLYYGEGESILQIIGMKMSEILSVLPLWMVGERPLEA